MNDQSCKDCRFFLQHYILDEQSCTAINCGHCTHRRLKHRQPDTPGRSHFLPRGTPPPMPATKHFLSLELLRWVQSLDFPPEVRTDLDKP